MMQSLVIHNDSAPRQHLGRVETAQDPGSGKSTLETLVQKTISDRSRRSKALPAHLFADPAWDMLLDLFRAYLAQHRVSVSSLCVASQVPATTALRWMNSLVAEGLIAREADPFDGRRFYLGLTEAGLTAMTTYFSGGLQDARQHQ